jgi:poly(A) polymerase
LLVRYKTTENGAVEKKAHIYTQEEHGIDPRFLDADAQWVVRRLRKEGFRAYIVGGAVRDLLVGRTPHDFDVATSAHPQQVKRLFRSARVIGRRFRLVHVYCGQEKFIEVSTFRSRSSMGTADHLDHPDINNFFGTMEEDAQRRDFTFNALYYCPIDHQLIDYVGGFPDIRHKRLRTLVRAETSFAEDPVRMLRAVKYASLMQFPVPLPLASLIRRMRESILSCSRERITEEVYKILTSGSSLPILELSQKLRLFEVIYPALARAQRVERGRFAESRLGVRLSSLDEGTAAGRMLDRNDMFMFLFHDLVIERTDLLEDPDPELLIQQYIRAASAPLFPSKKDLAIAAEGLLNEMRPHHGRRAAHIARERDAQQRDVPRRGEEQQHAGQAAGTGSGKKRRRRRGGRGRHRGPRTGPGAPPAQTV